MVNSHARQTNDLLHEAEQTNNQQQIAIKKIDLMIEEKVIKDSSPEAKRGRRQMLIRAAYGEFMCSLLFYFPIFGTIINGKLNNYSAEYITLSSCFVAGFQAVGISFVFSSISGAQFNSAISSALWLTGKLSNRRFVCYVLVQLWASVFAMILCSLMFSGSSELETALGSLAVVPGDGENIGKVFFSEYVLTFFLTYVAFTVAFEDSERAKKESMSFKSISDSKGLTLYASTPQSKTGFAPFSIGFTIFSLGLIGGSSGAAFNPGRLFGPALFSGKWSYLWLYWLAEVMGAMTAGLMIKFQYRLGVAQRKEQEVAAVEQAAVVNNRRGSQLETGIINPVVSIDGSEGAAVEI